MMDSTTPEKEDQTKDNEGMLSNKAEDNSQNEKASKALKLAKMTALARSLHEQCSNSPKALHKDEPVPTGGRLLLSPQIKQTTLHQPIHNPSAAELANDLASIRQSLSRLSPASPSPEAKRKLSTSASLSALPLSTLNKEGRTADRRSKLSLKENRARQSLANIPTSKSTRHLYARSSFTDPKSQNQKSFPLPSPVQTDLANKGWADRRNQWLSKYSESPTGNPTDDFFEALDGKLSTSSSQLTDGRSPSFRSLHISPASSGGKALVTLEDARASGLYEALDQNSTLMAFNPQSQQWEGGEPVDMSGFDSTSHDSDTTSGGKFNQDFKEYSDRSNFDSDLEGDITAAIRRLINPRARLQHQTNQLLALADNSSMAKSSKVRLIPPSVMRTGSESTNSDAPYRNTLNGGAFFNHDTFRWEFPSEEDEDLTGFSTSDESETATVPLAVPKQSMRKRPLHFSFGSSTGPSAPLSTIPSPPETIDFYKKSLVDWRDSFDVGDDWALDLEGEVQTTGLIRAITDSSSDHWTSEGDGRAGSPDQQNRFFNTAVGGQKVTSPAHRGPLLIRPEDVDMKALEGQLKQAQEKPLEENTAMVFDDDVRSSSSLELETNGESLHEDWDADFEGDLKVPIDQAPTANNPTTPTTPVVPRYARNISSVLHTFYLEDYPQAAHMHPKGVYFDGVKKQWVSLQDREKGESSGFESNEDNTSQDRDSIHSSRGEPVMPPTDEPIARSSKLKHHSLSPQPGGMNRQKKGFPPPRKDSSLLPRTTSDLLSRTTSDLLSRPGSHISNSSYDDAMLRSMSLAGEEEKSSETNTPKRSSSAPVRQREKERDSLQESDVTFNLTREHRQAFSRCQKEHKSTMVNFLGRLNYDRMDKEGARRLLERNPNLQDSDCDSLFDQSVEGSEDGEAKCEDLSSDFSSEGSVARKSSFKLQSAPGYNVSSRPASIPRRPAWHTVKGPITATAAGLVGSTPGSRRTFHHLRRSKSISKSKERNVQDPTAKDKRRVARFVMIRDAVLEQLNHC